MTRPPDWFDNDKLFFRLLAEGHHWALRVGARLLAEGFPVQVPVPTRRATIADRYEYADEVDLLVGRADPLTLEVKSRDLAFDEVPHSYPYRTAFVDTVAGWDAKQRPPAAVVLVSQHSGAMLVVPVRTSRPHWRVEYHTDHVRQITDRWYAVDRDDLKPFATLVSWLSQGLARSSAPAARCEGCVAARPRLGRPWPLWSVSVRRSPWAATPRGRPASALLPASVAGRRDRSWSRRPGGSVAGALGGALVFRPPPAHGSVANVGVTARSRSLFQDARTHLMGRPATPGCPICAECERLPHDATTPRTSLEPG